MHQILRKQVPQAFFLHESLNVLSLWTKMVHFAIRPKKIWFWYRKNAIWVFHINCSKISKKDIGPVHWFCFVVLFIGSVLWHGFLFSARAAEGSGRLVHHAPSTRTRLKNNKRFEKGTCMYRSIGKPFSRETCLVLCFLEKKDSGSPGWNHWQFGLTPPLPRQNFGIQLHTWKRNTSTFSVILLFMVLTNENTAISHASPHVIKKSCRQSFWVHVSSASSQVYFCLSIKCKPKKSRHFSCETSFSLVEFLLRLFSCALRQQHLMWISQSVSSFWPSHALTSLHPPSRFQKLRILREPRHTFLTETAHAFRKCIPAFDKEILSFVCSTRPKPTKKWLLYCGSFSSLNVFLTQIFLFVWFLHLRKHNLRGNIVIFRSYLMPNEMRSKARLQHAKAHEQRTLAGWQFKRGFISEYELCEAWHTVCWFSPCVPLG